MRENCFSSGTELFNLKLSLFKQRKFSELLGKLCLVMCAALRTFISFYWKSNIVEGNINCLDSLAVFFNECRIWATNKSLSRVLMMVYFDKEFREILTSSVVLSEDSLSRLLRVCYKYINLVIIANLFKILFCTIEDFSGQNKQVHTVLTF